jgi:cytochrome c-type biogenesis protein CcmH/NrfF
MQRWKSSFLVALLAAVALAQSASEWDSQAVNGIAAKLKCSCGCKQDIACTMPPYPCPVCKMNKVRIFNMLNQGMTESQILDTYVKENGKDVLVVGPGAAAMVGPDWVSRRSVPCGPGDPPDAPAKRRRSSRRAG